MVKSLKVRTLSVLTGVLVTLTALLGIGVQKVSAAQTDYKFDLGANAQGGYTSVSAAQGYSSSVGYGFGDTSGVKNVNASGSGALSDAVQFTSASANNTFNVDLPKGLYRVSINLGDTNRTSVYIENMLQIVNMTGNNAYHSILVPVTDGQLNIRAAAGKEGYAFSISLIEISRVSEDPTLPKTIWMCGDSTVCNYYPLDTSVQAGWGQVLGSYIDTKEWQVRDMAASGQYAKGFLNAGQFDAIEYYGKAGDIYVISIGINDTNYSNSDEYYECVTDMTKRAKAKGMKVILVKQQGRNGDAQRKPLLTGRWFGGELDKIGAEQGVQVIDLFTLWQDYCISVGEEETTSMYMDGDTLHPNRKGAMKLAELAAPYITGTNDQLFEVDENITFTLKNKNSGLYMYAENAANGANVSQNTMSAVTGNYLWSVKRSSTNGYYYVYSKLDKGQYLLDLTNGMTANGTNIGLYEDTKSSAQLFKLIDNGDGSICIATKNSNDSSCVEVKSALTDTLANVQEWERNGHDCQSWVLEKAELSVTPVAPPVKPGLKDNIIIGDINEDGVVNVFDYMLAKYRAGAGAEAEYSHNADTNSDGDINSDDVGAIGNFIIKKQNTFEAIEKSSTFYYAHSMNFSQGVTENTNGGFKKNSYINLDNVKGSYITFELFAPKDGNYRCDFRVANGSAVNRIMKVEVNGNKDYWLQDFLTTNAWTTWETRGIVLPLKKGVNTVRMTSETNEGGPNIDTLYIEWTDEPIAEVHDPNKNPVPEPAPAANPTIYIAGDSTVQTYKASYYPQQGWGAFLQENLSPDYTVSNHAIAGRSSKSFYDNGRLDTILNQMKAGDYLLVQFGINDSAYNNEERYAPVSGSVPGTDGSFEYYIAKYIEGAKAKGGTPVLVTTVLGLKAYNSSTGKFAGSYENYCSAMKKLAAYYNIPCIDLNSLMVNHYNSIGYDAAYNYHMISAGEGSTDMTHFTETGAKAVAKLVADELNKIL